jgi:primosomal protein N' (replication factor Y)
LTYFKTTKENYLKCSLCNQKTPIITTCPKCQSKNFEPTNLGIDKLEQNILDTLKDNHVKIFSIQSDDTEEHIDQTINQFMNSENGILIGTSAIFKPQISNIQNIAIINIDNLFSIPDFRTEEKVLTLI